MNKTTFQITSGICSNNRPYVPGVNCTTCGRFVGRDGWIEIEHLEMSDIVASVGGECATCSAAAAAREDRP